jgi:hypothetical protein
MEFHKKKRPKDSLRSFSVATRRKKEERNGRKKEELLNFPLSSRYMGFIEDIKENTFQHKPINYYVCYHRSGGEAKRKKRVKVNEKMNKTLNCEVCE